MFDRIRLIYFVPANQVVLWCNKRPFGKNVHPLVLDTKKARGLFLASRKAERDVDCFWQVLWKNISCFLPVVSKSRGCFCASEIIMTFTIISWPTFRRKSVIYLCSENFFEIYIRVGGIFIDGYRSVGFYPPLRWICYLAIPMGRFYTRVKVKVWVSINHLFLLSYIQSLHI